MFSLLLNCLFFRTEQARVSYAWGSKKQVNASWLSLQELQAFLIHWLGFTTYEQDEAPILMTSKASTGLEEVSGAATRRRSLSQSGNVLPHFGRLPGTANSEFASRFPVGQKSQAVDRLVRSSAGPPENMARFSRAV